MFLDYVHPTKRGNLLVANRVYDEIIARGLLGPPAAGTTTELSETAFTTDSHSGYDERRDYSMQGSWSGYS